MPEEKRREKKGNIIFNLLIFNDILVEIIFGEGVRQCHETVVWRHGNHSSVAWRGRWCGRRGTLVLRSVTDRWFDALVGNWQGGLPHQCGVLSGGKGDSGDGNAVRQVNEEPFPLGGRLAGECGLVHLQQVCAEGP